MPAALRSINFVGSLTLTPKPGLPFLTCGNHSSAFGAFQMIEATRKRYMGADYQSTDFSKQYSAATRYVTDRYGSWERAKSFWVGHHWY